MKKKVEKYYRKKTKKNGLKVLFPFLKPYLFLLICSVLCIVVATVFYALDPRFEGMVTTQLMKDALEISEGKIGAKVHLDIILGIIRTLVIIYLSRIIFTYTGSVLLTKSIQSFVRDLRQAVEQKIRRLPISYFDKNQIGDILSRISNDVDTLSNAMQQSFVQVVNGALTFTFAIIMMFIINIKMALITIIIVPLSYLISKYIVKKSQKYFNSQQKFLGILNSKVEEMYTGFSEIKLYGKEKDVVDEFKIVNGKLREYGFKSQFMSSLMNPLISIVCYFGIIVVAGVGVFNVINGIIVIGDLQAFIRYIWQVNQPLSQITQLSNVMQSAYAASIRIAEVLCEEEMDEEEKSIVEVSELGSDVEFENVVFSYDNELKNIEIEEDVINIDKTENQKKDTLKNISAKIKSGQMVAIVGPTGAGKTTLINLLMRFYEINSGKIKISGIDTKKIRKEELRSMFGMVLQDTWLFKGSIYENIAYGKEDASREEVMTAAKNANIDKFIRSLPNGYDTIINEEANNISAGEKQLLTIARAFLVNPKILILDEATSSVDTRLEKMLQDAMKKILYGRTSFVIAHRLSTIVNADLILVMNNGNIIEQGTHEELLNQKGFYANLYYSQFETNIL
ncbi:MAG: ABC transporter ATP-binding protein/permease [Clostridioides sp.]|nr:ABC transporter ATP-binding protein/permease [Clostridioides sp.]